MWGFFAVGLAVIAGTIAWLLRRYAAPSVPYIVLAATAYAWTVSMSIVLVVPLDVASTLLKRPERGISILWQITYWSTQVNTACCDAVFYHCLHTTASLQSLTLGCYHCLHTTASLQSLTLGCYHCLHTTASLQSLTLGCYHCLHTTASLQSLTLGHL
jgi:hypothetical protein